MKHEKVKRFHDTKESLEKELNRTVTVEEVNNEVGEDLSGAQYLIIDKEEEKIIEQLRFRLTVQNERLRDARLARKLRQVDVENHLGLTQQQLCAIENCKTYPSEEVQQKLCTFYGKSQQYLFPEWLGYFTEKWKRTEKEALVSYDTLTLSSVENALTSPVELEDLGNNTIRKAKIEEMFEILPAREKKILEMRFGLKDGITHTFDEVAREFDVTRERIRQIEAKAMERLKENFGDKLEKLL